MVVILNRPAERSQGIFVAKLWKQLITFVEQCFGSAQRDILR